MFVPRTAYDPVENATLMQLCAIAKTGIFEAEKDGHSIIFAYFHINGNSYIYHNGDSIVTAHLFFMLTSVPYKLKHSGVLDIINDIYGGGFIDSN